MKKLLIFLLCLCPLLPLGAGMQKIAPKAPAPYDLKEGMIEGWSLLVIGEQGRIIGEVSLGTLPPTFWDIVEAADMAEKVATTYKQSIIGFSLSRQTLQTFKKH
jgi:hypothetical protein